MKILGIMGSYRKGHTIDTLLDRALEGARSLGDDIQTEKIVLIDRHIEYCRNCAVCKEADPAKPYADCIIQDDMRDIYPKVAEADAFLFGTPVNMAQVTAVMKTFLERLCWTMARPGWFPLKGCPEPRCARNRHVALIVSSGLVPPLLRCFCDKATPTLKDFCHWALNAKTVGTMYAGAVHKRGASYYADQAYTLGRRLAAAAR